MIDPQQVQLMRDLGVSGFAIAALVAVVKVFASKKQEQEQMKVVQEFIEAIKTGQDSEQKQTLKIIQEFTEVMTGLKENMRETNKILSQHTLLLTDIRLSQARAEGRNE